MKNLKNSINSYSFTEKLTFSLLFFLVFILAFAFISDESGALKTVLGQETSDSSEASVDNGEESDSSESVASTDEVSVDDNTSLSVASTDEVSVDDDTTESVDEVSVVSEETEISVASEVSVESEEETSVSDFESIVQIDENRVVASESGRLFYLIPIKITKTLSLDSQGNVVDIQQTLLSRLLELLSF